MQLASSGERLGARVIDVGISFGFFILVGWWSTATWVYDGSMGPLDEWRFIWLPAMAVVFMPIYRIIATALWGQTLGKRVLSIRVVDSSTGQRLRWHQSLARTAVPIAGGLIALPGLYFWFVFSMVGGSAGASVFILFLCVVVVCLCYLSITWHTLRQGWHDRAAKTLVVRLP